MGRPHAVAAESEARDASGALGDELGGGQPSAQAGQHDAALGAEGRGVVAAQCRPIGIGERAHGMSGGGLVVPTRCGVRRDEAVESPRKSWKPRFR